MGEVLRFVIWKMERDSLI